MIFLKNFQINWKYILIVTILAFFVGVGILFYSEFPPYSEFPSIKFRPKLKERVNIEEAGVSIATEKTEYEWGEIIKIIIRNNSEKLVSPLSCCNLYKLENNEWKSLGNITLFFQTPISLIELKPGESSEGKLDILQYPDLIESGKYKLSFNYRVIQENYSENTIYSNEFAIKENWKIYKNKGISFKYPSIFKYKEEGQIDFKREDGAPFFSFLIFAPTVSSLEDYLKFYADKLGKEIKSKEMKTFGEVEKGIFYTLSISFEREETGYIFSYGPFTYHFWRDNTHMLTEKPESIEPFLQTLSTLKFSEPFTKVSTQEIEKERIYRNEIYGIEFKYPKEWGSLALQSIKKDVIGSKIYRFVASSESISEIYYHQPSQMIAFIAKGERYEAKVGRGWNRQDILRIYKDKKIKTIYTLSPGWVAYFGRIENINFSPDGKYIYFGIYGWEAFDCKMINIDTGLNIVNCNIVHFSDPYQDVYWSPNNKVLAIKSYHSPLEGIGTFGLFVSDYGNPEKLNKAFAPSWKEAVVSLELDKPELYSFYNLAISDLYFIDDNKLSFLLSLREWNPEKMDYDILKTTKYEYIVNTKELRRQK
jgi:hypothetical protein